MIDAWIAWSLAVDDYLEGYRDETIEQMAQRYARANGATAEELEFTKQFVKVDEIERHLKERGDIDSHTG